MSASSKGGTTQQQTTLDPGMMAYRNDVFNRARQVGNEQYNPYGGQLSAGQDPRLGQASTGYGQAMGGLGLGMQGLGQQFDPNSVGGFMSPYQQQVMDAMNKQFGNTAAMVSNQVNSDATSRGAFGGSRAAIAQGQALGDLGRSQNEQVGNMLNSGYQNAMGQALNAYGQNQQGYGQLANLGLSGAQGLGGIGMYGQQMDQNALDRLYGQFQNQQNWGARNLGLMQGAMQGAPYGQTQTATAPTNWLSTLGGLGLTGASLFMPGGLLARRPLGGLSAASGGAGGIKL